MIQVLVTGGAGFIGRYVCEYLFRSGVRVRIATRDRRNDYFLQPLGQDASRVIAFSSQYGDGWW